MEVHLHPAVRLDDELFTQLGSLLRQGMGESSILLYSTRIPRDLRIMTFF